MRLTANANKARRTVDSGAAVGVNYFILSPRLAAAAKDKGAEINVYTVNDKRSVKRCLELGVNYITTDYIF
ncbi:MAG: glycerophosphodiester phosphodiesterase family protein, partial [Clostridia bacterium]|nr:glycerophosphodiester phosphodiesterase family protein [Clostridia bacterium]